MSVKAAGVLAISPLPLWMGCAWKHMFVSSFCWSSVTNHTLLIYKKAEKWSRIVSKMSLFLSLSLVPFLLSSLRISVPLHLCPFPPSLSPPPSFSLLFHLFPFLLPFPYFACSLPPFPSSSSSIVKSESPLSVPLSPHFFFSVYSSLPNVRLVFGHLPESSAEFKRAHPSHHFQSQPAPPSLTIFFFLPSSILVDSAPPPSLPKSWSLPYVHSSSFSEALFINLPIL